MERKSGIEERRKDVRVFIKKPLVVKFHVKKQRGLFNLLSQGLSEADNMSVGGVALELPALGQKQVEKIIKGDNQIVMEFNIPSFKKPLKVKGKIAWLKKRDNTGKAVYVTGLSFENLRQEDREKLLLQLLNICSQGKCAL